MQYADLIVPKGIKNKVAIKLIAKHIESVLQERGFETQLSRSLPQWNSVPENIHIMEQTEHLKALHTNIRNKGI